MTTKNIDALYENYRDALVNVLIGYKTSYAGRETLFKAQDAVIAHPEFDRVIFDGVILKAHTEATRLWSARAAGQPGAPL